MKAMILVKLLRPRFRLDACRVPDKKRLTARRTLIKETVEVESPKLQTLNQKNPKP